MEDLCRSNVETSTGVAQRVTTQYFFEHVLPALPAGLAVNDVLTTLRRSGKRSHRIITQRGRWRGFSEDPDDDTREKHANFGHFAAIVNAISVATTSRGHAPTMQFTQHLSEQVDEATDAPLPDGYTTPVGAAGKTWADIGVVGWYSQSDDCANTYKVSTCPFVFDPRSYGLDCAKH